MDPEKHYHDRMKVFASETHKPGAITLVGSSHFEWFNTDKFLPEWRFVNRGIVSDRLGITDRGILHRLDVSIYDLNPSFIVFNNSVNDLGELWRNGEPSMDEIKDAFDRVINTIRAGAPDTPMLIINELPTSGEYGPLNPYIVEMNAHIRTVADKYGMPHLDIHSVLVSDAGDLPADLTDDGLHLNDAGYQIFADHLRPHLPEPR